MRSIEFHIRAQSRFLVLRFRMVSALARVITDVTSNYSRADAVHGTAGNRTNWADEPIVLKIVV